MKMSEVNSGPVFVRKPVGFNEAKMLTKTRLKREDIWKVYYWFTAVGNRTDGGATMKGGKREYVNSCLELVSKALGAKDAQAARNDATYYDLLDCDDDAQKGGKCYGYRVHDQYVNCETVDVEVPKEALLNPTEGFYIRRYLSPEVSLEKDEE